MAPNETMIHPSPEKKENILKLCLVLGSAHFNNVIVKKGLIDQIKNKRYTFLEAGYMAPYSDSYLFIVDILCVLFNLYWAMKLLDMQVTQKFFIELLKLSVHNHIIIYQYARRQRSNSENLNIIRESS